MRLTQKRTISTGQLLLVVVVVAVILLETITILLEIVLASKNLNVLACLMEMFSSK